MSCQPKYAYSTESDSSKPSSSHSKQQGTATWNGRDVKPPESGNGESCRLPDRYGACPPCEN